jgi:3-isopropylmalate/(R)-2-methylmalate dehydratase large subunit
VSRTFAQKALARAAGTDRAEVGSIVMARPDRILSHDNTAAIARIWERFGQDRLERPELLAITLDHAVPAPTSRHAANHDEVRRFVARHGVEHFFEAGRGICHQVLSEEALVLPGELILGADSHTTHFGWMGAFGAGIGRTEVAALWATGELWLRVPESIRVDVRGTFPSTWVGAKDLALHVVRRLGAEGALYKSVELHGPAIEALDPAGRMVLANMMAEAGAKAAYLPPDDRVFAYLAERLARRLSRRGRPVAPPECAARVAAGALYPDAGADYAARLEVDVSTLAPQVARPHTVDSGVGVDELAGLRVHQAFLGTCTNGRLEDLAEAHRVLAGRRVAPGTRLLVVPASSEVLAAAVERGWVADFLAAGAMLGTPGCGPCMGNHMGVLAPGEVCISSGNRNFQGRMGTPEAEIYLASPAVVAASAVAGRIAHPAEVCRSPPRPPRGRCSAPWAHNGEEEAS